MFAVGAFLGLLLLRGRLKVAACLMVAPLVLVPLAVMLNFAAPRLAHPAYAETALYIGLALLGALADQPATGEQQASSLIGRDTVKPSQT